MKYRDKILELRKQGKSYKQISDELGCTKSTVCFHCGKGQKTKNYNRAKQCRNHQHPFIRKIESFHNPNISNITRTTTHKTKKLIQLKIETFCSIRQGGNKIYNKPTFTVQDVIDKFGNNPKCYLTNESIDISKPRTYHFDHIIPASKGGSNDITNLGLCTKDANNSKTDLTLEEYISLCKKVLETHGYNVTKN